MLRADVRAVRARDGVEAVAVTTHPPFADPRALLGGPEVDALDARVEAAIRSGHAGPLRVLGYGEITLVLGWPTDRPAVAVKRLPLFASPDQVDRYDRLVARYIDELERRGVPVVPTVLRRPSANPCRAYLIQPLVPRATLLNHVLATAAADRGARLLATLVQHVVDAVDDRVGLDAQAANWTVDGDTLTCLDISTPMMCGADGREELELSVFLSVYPWALRPALGRVGQSVMSQYHDARNVIVDVASNLIKERLERWIGPLLEAANRHVAPAIDEAEVRRYFARDKQLWLLMQRLRRLDRGWQRQVRRRPYPFLLPPPYAYGPPELPEEIP